MARVITFSTVFPARHRKAGQPTDFERKILLNLGFGPKSDGKVREVGKYHTIRQGFRWKIGDLFSPRVWTGRPYASKQRRICESDLQVTWVQGFKVMRTESGLMFWRILHTPSGYADWHPFRDISTLAKFDGLNEEDFCEWFAMNLNKPGQVWQGQIISWLTPIIY